MVNSDYIKSRFFDFMVESNGAEMAGFQKWVFHAGMLFNSSEKWWRKEQPRSTAHEGLDLCYFADATGKIKKVDMNFKIPATFAGIIVKIADDYLGKSIFLRHEIFSECGKQLYTVYGHTTPFDAMTIGRKVAEGELIATISEFPDKKTSLLPHLHITLAWIPITSPPDHLNWQKFGHDPTITLIDPLAVLLPLGQDFDYRGIAHLISKRANSR